MKRFAFRSSSSISPVSLQYRGNTAHIGWGSVVVVFVFCFCGGFLGFVCCFGVGVFVLFPPSICSVSYPSTMTWAHRPHGVRTRGKKVSVLSLAVSLDAVLGVRPS